MKALNLKVAVPSKNGNVDDHFGHCEQYTIFTIENGELVNKESLKSPEGCGCKSNIAPILVQMGVTVMLAGSMGMGALNMLNFIGIDVIRGCSGDIDKVISDFLENKIADSGEGCRSHDNCHSN